jgi:anaerobic ribonucleoside-triphosphate reductase
MTRVTGFFSKVEGWNKGKVAELRDRRDAVQGNKKAFGGM